MNSQRLHGELSSPRSSRKGTRLILSVDDEPAILYARQAILQSAGYEVLNAADGEQALHLVASYSACIDLVLLDYRMPGSDGGIVAQEMTRCKPGMPIILVSASATAQEILPFPCMGRIDKDQGPIVLLNEIARLLTTLQGRRRPPTTAVRRTRTDQFTARRGIGG